MLRIINQNPQNEMCKELFPNSKIMTLHGLYIYDLWKFDTKKNTSYLSNCNDLHHTRQNILPIPQHNTSKQKINTLND